MKSVVMLLSLALLSVTARAEPAKVRALTFELPPGLTAQPSPPSRGEAEVHRWQALDGRRIEVFVYDQYIKQDRGGILAETKDPIEVAGQRTKLIATKIFFGEPKRVLAVYLNLGETIYLIVGERMSEKEFVKVLQGISHES